MKTNINWKAVRAGLDTEKWEVCADDSRCVERRTFLGTVFSIMPSGKFYAPWACSNVTRREAEKDERFMEALEVECEKYGVFVMSGEGDPCDMFIGECKDCEDVMDSEGRPLCADCGEYHHKDKISCEELAVVRSAEDRCWDATP